MDSTLLNEITSGKEKKNRNPLGSYESSQFNVTTCLSHWAVTYFADKMLSLPSPKHEAVEAPGIRHLGFEIVKSQSVPKDPATVSSRGSLAGTVLLITSPVNALPSHTVSVCIISYLCSNVHPTNSELDEFCHLRREFGTFFWLRLFLD